MRAPMLLAVNTKCTPDRWEFVQKISKTNTSAGNFPALKRMRFCIGAAAAQFDLPRIVEYDGA